MVKENICEVLRTLKKILIHPTDGFNDALKNKLLLPSALLIIINGLSFSVEANLVDFGRYNNHVETYLWRTPTFPPLVFIGLWLGVGLFLFLGGKRLKGNAQFTDILIVTGLSSLPIIIGNIFAMIFLLSGITGGVIYRTLVFNILLFWFVMLFIIGIKEANKFSLKKSFGTIAIASLYLSGIYMLVSLGSGLFKTYF